MFVGKRFRVNTSCRNLHSPVSIGAGRSLKWMMKPHFKRIYFGKNMR